MGRIQIRLGLLACVGGLAWAARAQAGDFFNVTATGSGGTMVSVGGDSIINLSRDFVNEEKSFSVLAGQNVVGKFTYAGIPNALIFTENASQSQATLTIPLTGFTKTFTATASSSLDDQIVQEFIKTDGSHAYAEFIEAVDRMSPVATLDGNPQASTAVIADAVFDRFGIQDMLSQAPKEGDDSHQFTVDTDGGVIRSDGFDGNWANINVDGIMRFTDNVALSLGTTIDVRSEGGSQAYTIAEEVGLPITIINNRGDGLSWQVTPWAFGGLSASYDQAAGTVLVGGGGTSSLALHMGDFTLTVADQASYAGDVPVDVDGYGFSVVVDQWIVKNGADVAYQPHGTPFFVDASIAYSNFVRPAAVPNYWSPSVGAGIKFDKYSGLRVGYAADFGSGYNANGGDITLFLSY